MFDRIIPELSRFPMLLFGMATAGFVLTGGKSSRMGQDKALLPWHEAPLVEHIARCVATVTGNVTLVGAPERYSNLSLPAIADSYHDRGPLAGVEAALSSDKSADYNLIVACDLPDLALDTALLEQLLAAAMRSHVLCVAAQGPEGRVHPLCAVYRPNALPVVRQSLRDHRLRLTELIERLDGEVWPVSAALANVNSPEDWLAWQTK